MGNRRMLNLCLCKNLLIRFVEEHYDKHAARVMTCLLSEVKPREDPAALDQHLDTKVVRELTPNEIDARMTEFGFRQGGRDPIKEREMLFGALNRLIALDSLVKRKQGEALSTASG